MCKVSVIIPVYGVEKYIERCARSLFEQTLDDIEFIFVDDCTPDRSISVLKMVLNEYPSRKGHVKIVHHDKNLGLPQARQTGLKISSGEYIAHCDSDDWVDVTMYEKMYNKAVEEQADMVVCGYKETDGKDVIKQDYHNFQSKEEYIANMLSRKEVWSIWDKLCKRTLYDGIEYPIYSMGEDILFTFQLVLKAKVISNIQSNLYRYYFNPTSITKTVLEEKRYRNWIQSVDNADKALKIINDTTKRNQYVDEIVVFKYYQKKISGDLVWKKQYAKIWLSLYPEINTKVIFSKSLSLEKK